MIFILFEPRGGGITSFTVRRMLESVAIGNFTLAARPNASFARRWLAAYDTFGSGSGDSWS